MAKDGGPAFPIPVSVDADGTFYSPYDLGGDPIGMSLRDYFAAKAMQAFMGQLSSLDRNDESGGQIAIESKIAMNSYRFADAMLVARDA